MCVCVCVHYHQVCAPPLSPCLNMFKHSWTIIHTPPKIISSSATAKSFKHSFTNLPSFLSFLSVLCQAAERAVCGAVQGLDTFNSLDVASPKTVSVFLFLHALNTKLFSYSEKCPWSNIHHPLY